MKTKVILENGSDIWDSKKRYKVNQSVLFNGVSYQNTTGANSSPDLLVDWILVDVNSSKNLQQTLNNGKSATIISENGDVINIDFNTEEAGQGTTQIMATSSDDKLQSIINIRPYDVGLSSLRDEDDFVGQSTETTVPPVSSHIDFKTYHKQNTDATQSGSVSFRQLPPAIDNRPIEVVIEMPHKEVSGNYRVSTADDISNQSQVLNKTTTEINAIASPVEGEQYYNTTLHTICFFNGKTWQRVTSINM